MVAIPGRACYKWPRNLNCLLHHYGSISGNQGNEPAGKWGHSLRYNIFMFESSRKLWI